MTVAEAQAQFDAANKALIQAAIDLDLALAALAVAGASKDPKSASVAAAAVGVMVKRWLDALATADDALANLDAEIKAEALAPRPSCTPARYSLPASSLAYRMAIFASGLFCRMYLA